ncbi:hypothetical protein DPMN_162408 [Dreissena polymorpha]|uniref:Uncharacterized protein n=1 Tax=Dreissena polymorpha TaxID=45954 RepID=A0A9D4ERL9_DREPO|nr:hypothetical protein DPMN_162408 [Dreissena polymorpha]
MTPEYWDEIDRQLYVLSMVPLFCSQLSVTWHRTETRDMLVFDHLLYKMLVYGCNKAASYKNSFSRTTKSRNYRTEFPP